MWPVTAHRLLFHCNCDKSSVKQSRVIINALWVNYAFFNSSSHPGLFSFIKAVIQYVLNPETNSWGLKLTTNVRLLKMNSYFDISNRKNRWLETHACFHNTSLTTSLGAELDV